MPYDENFYRMYEAYLREPTVRRSHDLVFKMFARETGERLWVMDLGCGRSQEYANFDPAHAAYVGIDLNVPEDAPAEFMKALIRTDYTDFASFKERLPFQPNAFVSLFSIEPFNAPSARYALYEKIFAEFPTLKFGLASGFFYESKRDQPTVGEAGDIISHQTIEDQRNFASTLFDERRFVTQTPSKMFGDDVVEIWKFFTRK